MEVNILKRKFNSRTKKNGTCLIWTGAVSHGKGIIRYDNNVYQARRLSLFIKTGIMPKRNIKLKCDNKLCVNPNHLVETSPPKYKSKNVYVKKADRKTNKDFKISHTKLRMLCLKNELNDTEGVFSRG